MTSSSTTAQELTGTVQSGAVTVTREIFKDAPTSMKAALYAPAIAATVFGPATIIAVLTQSHLSILFGVFLLIGLFLPHWKPLKLDCSIFRMDSNSLGVPFESSQPNAALPRCRSFPVFPLDEACVSLLKPALHEILSLATSFIQSKVDGIEDGKIRANVFLLASIRGGTADGCHKLVIERKLTLNMNHEPELGLQFSIGQGATGVVYRDGVFRLTRRLNFRPRKGAWPSEFKLTPELEAQVHRNLKWIVSIPLLKPTTNEAQGVLNIDGLCNVDDDEVLEEMPSTINEFVEEMARTLSLQPSTCMGQDRLGVVS